MKSLNNYLAKSEGDDIITHTDKAIYNSEILCHRLNLNKTEGEIVKYSSLFHDIGKLRKRTQTFFKKGLEDSSKYKFAHNIIGWFFVLKYVKHKDKVEIANLVLWHHANVNSCENLNHKLLEIEDEITEDEIELMKRFARHYGVELIEDGEDDVEMESRFYKLDPLLRSILISSDSCASSNENVETLFKKTPMKLEDINEEFLNSERTQEQIEIVKRVMKDSTTLIKATTGFGKSVINLILALLGEKQLIWTCPTNIIAESIYDDVMKILKMMGIDINVELYLTGERKKANNELEDFKSDIIITNIDNYVKPSVSNSYGYRCLMIYDCDVIFDEPHEYEGMDYAMYEAYNNIMSERHNRLNSTTVMTTATEPTFRFKKVGGKDIVILPNKEEHFKAVHQEGYQLFFHDEGIPKDLMKGEFVHFSHMVNDVQDKYTNYDGDKLISHGRYLDDDKHSRKQLVLDNYNKGGERKEVAVFTNQILTTSCDYSVNKIFIKSPSVKILQQTFGRVNRWGGMGKCEVHIDTSKSKGDYMVIGNKYENLYQKIFVDTLRKKFENKIFILDELYIFLNEFNKKYEKLRNDISKKNLIISKTMMQKVYPKKFKDKSKTKIANGNKLRRSTNSNEMFIIVKEKDLDKWVTINFNIPTIRPDGSGGTAEKFNEDRNTFKKQMKVIKTLDGYNKYKNITPEILRDNSIFYDTPYPVFNYVYDTELGLLKTE